MSASTPPPVVQEDDLNRLRYELAVTKAGRDALASVFAWLYQGGHPVKTHLTQIPEYTDTEYKLTFDAHHRDKLEKSTDVTAFDITLIYKLLQRVCGLAKTNAATWTTPGPTLEHFIYKVKQHYNTMALEHVKMTEEDLMTTLTEFKYLLRDMLAEAGVRCGKDSQEVDHVIKDVIKYIDGLRGNVREPLDPSDMTHLDQLHQEIEDYKTQITKEIKEMSKQEVTDGYKKLYQIVPASWLPLNIKYSPGLTFTSLQLVQDPTKGARPSHTSKDIKHEDLLSSEGEYEKAPQCILLTGEDDMSKTTLLKLILEKWVEDPAAIRHLGTVDLVFYVQCRDTHLNTFDDLLKILLSLTFQKSEIDFKIFKNIILNLHILVLIDGCDEMNVHSEKLVKELFGLPGKDVRLVVTTRSGWEKEFSELVPTNKTRCNIKVLGISTELHSEYANRIINVLVVEENQQRAISERFIQRLEQLGDLRGEYLNNPPTLTLLALLCVEAPEEFNKLTTVTEVYEAIHQFITNKLISRLEVQHVTNSKEKCDKFLFFFEEVSLKAINRKEFDLLQATVDEIRIKCDSLELPQEEVLSTYFTRTSSCRGTEIVLMFGYFHSRYQEHCASKALVTQLLTAEEGGEERAPYSVSEEDLSASLVRDVLLQGEENMQVEVLNENRCQNILLSTTGVLCTRNPTHRFSSRVTEQVISLVNFQRDVNGLLRHIFESLRNEDVIKAVLERLPEQEHWEVYGVESYAVLPLVLEEVIPDSILLGISGREQPSQLQLVMSLLANMDITVSVDESIDYYDRTDGLSDMCLEILTAPGSKCSLDKFEGHLSEGAIPRLPDTLTQLTLTLSLPQLRALITHLPHLYLLEDLGIILEAPRNMDVATLSSLPYEGDLLHLTIHCDLTDDDPDLERCCDIISQLCPQSRDGHYNDLTFIGTHLTSEGIEELILELLERRVTAGDNFNMYCEAGSTQELATRHGLSQLYIY
nr:uncharacterized protein LOC123770539 [Procambarus clarkii]